MNLRDPTTDDRAELVDAEEAGIIYRLRNCGRCLTCRLVTIYIVSLLVIGAIVAVTFILVTRGKAWSVIIITCNYTYIYLLHM